MKREPSTQLRLPPQVNLRLSRAKLRMMVVCDSTNLCWPLLHQLIWWVKVSKRRPTRDPFGTKVTNCNNLITLTRWQVLLLRKPFNYKRSMKL